MFVAKIQTGNSGAANLRATKSTGSQLIGTLSNGTNVNIVRCDDTWATLQYNGIPCFILLRLLDDYPVSYGEGIKVQAPYGPHATLWGYCPREFIDVSYSSNNSINELFGTDFITTYSTGGFVYNLQNFLNRFYDAENRGNGIDVDGNFGGENSETRNAVREFQEFAGLDADGVVGNATKLALLQYVTNLNA